MKYLVLLPVLYLFFCNTSKHPVTSNPEPGLTELLFKLEYNSIDAEFRLDTAAIAAIMDEGFISINEKEVPAKQEELLGSYNNIRTKFKKSRTKIIFFSNNYN